MADDRQLREMTCDPRFRKVLITDGKTKVGQALARAVSAAGADIVVEASRLEKPEPLLKTEWISKGACVIPYGTMSAVEIEDGIDVDGAATIYRRCRRAGITPRGLVDCMIVAVAVRHDATVLSQDADMARIAEVTTLRLDPASLRPG